VQVIYWRTKRYTYDADIYVHIVWEENGRVFGKVASISYIKRCAASSFSLRFSPCAYEHVKAGFNTDPLSRGCSDARSFHRDMPKHRRRLPQYEVKEFSRASWQALLKYMANQWKRHPEVRKPGYIWKCDE